MSDSWFWIFIQIGALVAIPIAALQAFNLWALLRSDRFSYVPLNGPRVPTTRKDRPGWYWYAVVTKGLSLIVTLVFIGFVGFWTFHPH